MNDIGLFWKLKMTIDAAEALKAEANKTLDETYPELIKVCPHSEALDWNFGLRQGDFRVCMICGLEDHASQGGTPGDEYDYGYPGYPNNEFWKGANVRKAKDEKEFWSYRRSHNWRVRDGKAVK